MKSTSASPTSLYNEAFLDSSNPLPKFCPFGMNCRSLKPGQAKCIGLHVDNAEKMIDEVKQMMASSNQAKNLVETTPKDNTDNSSEILSGFKVPGFSNDISIISKLIMPKIPNARYKGATLDLKNGTISFEIISDIDDTQNTSKSPMPDFLNSVISSAFNSEVTTIKPIEKVPNLDVNFGNSKNIFSFTNTKNKSTNSTIEISDKSPWIDVLTRKESKKVRQDGAASPVTNVLMKSERASPVPTNMMKAGRASPVPIMKAERASPVPIMKAERDSPIPESKISSGKIFKMKCNYKEKCNKPDCSYEHPVGYIPGSIGPNICHNATKCFNQNCKFVHPDGYVPKPNVRCLGGDDCHKEKMKKGSCPFSHPDDKYWNDIPENTRKYNKKF
jgi:hypothetical protein